MLFDNHFQESEMSSAISCAIATTSFQGLPGLFSTGQIAYIQSLQRTSSSGNVWPPLRLHPGTEQVDDGMVLPVSS